MYYKATFRFANADEPGFESLQQELPDLSARGSSISEAIDSLVELARHAFFGEYGFSPSDTYAEIDHKHGRTLLVFSVDNEPAVTYATDVDVVKQHPVDNEAIEEAL